jgi:hypothetical protein
MRRNPQKHPRLQSIHIFSNSLLSLVIDASLLSSAEFSSVLADIRFASTTHCCLNLSSPSSFSLTMTYQRK